LPDIEDRRETIEEAGHEATVGATRPAVASRRGAGSSELTGVGDYHIRDTLKESIEVDDSDLPHP
jgi:hypothetical protein